MPRTDLRRPFLASNLLGLAAFAALTATALAGDWNTVGGDASLRDPYFESFTIPTISTSASWPALNRKLLPTAFTPGKNLRATDSFTMTIDGLYSSTTMYPPFGSVWMSSTSMPFGLKGRSVPDTLASGTESSVALLGMPVTKSPASFATIGNDHFTCTRSATVFKSTMLGVNVGSGKTRPAGTVKFGPRSVTPRKVPPASCCKPDAIPGRSV